MFSLKTCVTSAKNTRKKTFLLVLAVSLLSMVLMGAMYDSPRKNITVMVHDSFSGVDMVKTVTTKKETVGELFDEIYITMDDKDSISHELDYVFADGDTITLTRAKSVSLVYDGIYAETVATSKNVSDILEAAEVVVNPDDIVTPSLDSTVNEGDTISVVRVEYEEYKTQEEIPFKEIKNKDNTLYVGESKVVKEGKNGLKEYTYAKTMHDGNVVSDVLISEQIITEATDKVISVGTKAKPVQKQTNTANEAGTQSGGSTKGFSYKKKLTVNASAYEPYNCGGDGRGITATGIKAQFGVVAVDPKVIPLGSKLYIESTDDGKSWTYGYAIAADTGGAIKGNKIDLCYNSRSECIQFGRRSATVYILD